MTFGGLYREVSLRIVPQVFLDNLFAEPRNVLSASPSLNVHCFLAGDLAAAGALSLQAELREGDRVLAQASRVIERVAAKAAAAGDPSASLDPHTDAAVYATTETTTDPARFTVSLPISAASSSGAWSSRTFTLCTCGCLRAHA